MSNKPKWGYDQDKKMLNKIRSLNESFQSNKNRLVEEDQPEQDSSDKSYTAIDNGIGVEVSSDGKKIELTTEQRNGLSQLVDSFKEQVSDSVTFPVGFNIKDNEIRLDGELTDKDFSFVLIKNSETPGVYINCNMTKLDFDILEILEKLEKFEHVYMDAATKLIDELKQGNL